MVGGIKGWKKLKNIKQNMLQNERRNALSWKLAWLTVPDGCKVPLSHHCSTFKEELQDADTSLRACWLQKKQQGQWPRAGALPGATLVKLLLLVAAAARPDWEETCFSFAFGRHLKGYGFFFFLALWITLLMLKYTLMKFFPFPQEIFCVNTFLLILSAMHFAKSNS